jgi:hypothetical protein
MKKKGVGLLHAAAILCLGLLSRPTWAGGNGTTAASFLELPTGAGPAALGGAYSTQADVYAPDWNPAALGFLESTQIAGQHLSYVESIHFETLQAVHPVHRGWGLGASVRYLGSGDMPKLDLEGESRGDFSFSHSAVSLATGHRIGSRLAFGAGLRWIHGKLDAVQADAYSATFGSLFQASPAWRFAAVLSDAGAGMRFRDQRDPLPTALRLGTAWKVSPPLQLSCDALLRKEGPRSFHSGVAWRALPSIDLRAGYRTDTLKGLSFLAGLSMGVGFFWSGQELAYTWRPVGDLGDTHALSFHLRFGEAERARRNLIHYRPQQVVSGPETDPLLLDYEMTGRLLSVDEAPAALHDATAPSGDSSR